MLTNVTAFFLCVCLPEALDNGIISAVYTKSQTKSPAGACHPIIDSVIYEFPLHGTLKCFHLNHYWATWIVRINLPLCSTYNDRSSKGEIVSVRRAQLRSHLLSAYVCACLSRMKLGFLTVLFIGTCYSTAFFTHNLTIPPTIYCGCLREHNPCLLLKLLSVKES